MICFAILSIRPGVRANLRARICGSTRAITTITWKLFRSMWRNSVSASTKANSAGQCWPTWRMRKAWRSGVRRGLDAAFRDVAGLRRRHGRETRYACHSPVPEVAELTAFFHRVASDGTPEEALAAFYAVMSRKYRGSRRRRRAGCKRCMAPRARHCLLHPARDGGCLPLAGVASAVGKRLESHPRVAEQALAAGENAAKALWHALDWGLRRGARRRQQRRRQPSKLRNAKWSR